MYPWDRQLKETEEAHEAFLLYRNMRAGDRSQTKVAAELGKSTTLINRWSSKHQWLQRVAAWDEEVQKELDDEMIEEVKKTNHAVHEACTQVRNKVVEQLLGLDYTKLSVEQLMLVFDTIQKHDRAALGQDGRAAGPGGKSGPTGAPRFLKLYAGTIDLSEV